MDNTGSRADTPRGLIPGAKLSAPAGCVEDGGLHGMGALRAGANLIRGELTLSLPGVGNLTGLAFPGKRKAGPTVGEGDDVAAALAGLGEAE